MSTPDDRQTVDAVWSEFAAPPPGPVPAPTRSDPMDDPAAWRGLGYFLLVATVSGCGPLLIFRSQADGVGWSLLAAGIAVLGGGGSGFLLAPSRPLAGLLAGVCSGLGGVAAALWAAGRLPAPDPAIVGLLGLNGLVPGVAAYHPLHRLLARLGRTPSGQNTRPAGQPLAVIYEPPPDPPDPRTAALEERLLHLCKQDRRVFDRLLHYERTQHPDCRREELLRLAIEHFERDNR